MIREGGLTVKHVKKILIIVLAAVLTVIALIYLYFALTPAA